MARDEAGFVERGQVMASISTSLPCVYYLKQLLFQRIKEICGYLLFILKNSIKYFLAVYLIPP